MWGGLGGGVMGSSELGRGGVEWAVCWGLGPFGGGVRCGVRLCGEVGLRGGWRGVGSCYSVGRELRRGGLDWRGLYRGA